MSNGNDYTIKNLQNILSTRIGNDKKITNTKIAALTAPGENYGSIMTKLDIIIKNEHEDTEKELHLVAKQIPDDEIARKIFNIQVTFKNEIAMYSTIFPKLQQFQRENGVNRVINCFAEYYGSRTNTNQINDTVDEDGVLILENLNFKGYTVVDRYIGFNLETTQLILKDLAAFHAVPLALKLRKPEEFDQFIKPYLSKFTPPSMPKSALSLESVLLSIIADSPKCVAWVEKIKNMLASQKEIRNESAREPFATVIHGDMWVNNTMVKFLNGVPVQNKLVDFQVCDYGSPAKDLLFLLFTSVELEVLKESLDSLIMFYHNQFISHLKMLKCDIAPFSLPKLLKEICISMPSEVPHAIIMTAFIIHGKKGERATDMKEPTDLEEAKARVSPLAKERIWFMIEECGKKGWL